MIQIKDIAARPWHPKSTTKEGDDMIRLAMTLYSVIGTTLAGSAVVAALVMGYDTWLSLLIAAVIGFVLAVPAALGVARAMTR